MALTITSISPASAPPGGAVTVTGTGFVAGSRVGCPALVATAYVSATQLTFMVPMELAGPAGETQQFGVFVQNPDGTISNVVMMGVAFPAVALQGWTTVRKVAGEIPGFVRGGKISDAKLQDWIEGCAQEIRGVMLRRGLSLDPADWQQPGADANPEAAGLLEAMNRAGAAADLAYAAIGMFTQGDTGFAKQLRGKYDRMRTALEAGQHDKLFKPSAATVESGPLMAAGDTSDSLGNSTTAFTKEKVF